MIFGLLATPNEFTITFAGDLMLNGIKPEKHVFADVAKTLGGSDLCLANLEIPLTDSKAATKRKTPAELKKRTQFVLKADPKHAPFVRQAGIDMVSLANNHGMDYGAAGSVQMRKALDQLKIAHAGAGSNAAEAMRIATFTLRNGKKVGLFSALAFIGRGALLKTTPATTSAPGINVLNFGGKIDDEAKSRIERIVSSAKEACDFLIVGLHWGIERQTVPTSYQVDLGRAFVSAGADVVWGHHPHVLQGAEMYDGHPILYSMGNLISPTPAKTAIVALRFVDGKLHHAWVQPCLISGGKVSPVTGATARAERKRFSELGDAMRKRYPNKASQPLPFVVN